MGVIHPALSGRWFGDQAARGGEPPAEWAPLKAMPWSLPARLTVRSKRASKQVLVERWHSLGRHHCCCCGQHALRGRRPFPELLILLSLYPDEQAGYPALLPCLVSGHLASVFTCLWPPASPLNSVVFPSPRQTFFCCNNYYCYC